MASAATASVSIATRRHRGAAAVTRSACGRGGTRSRRRSSTPLWWGGRGGEQVEGARQAGPTAAVRRAAATGAGVVGPRTGSATDGTRRRSCARSSMAPHRGPPGAGSRASRRRSPPGPPRRAAVRRRRPPGRAPCARRTRGRGRVARHGRAGRTSTGCGSPCRCARAGSGPTPGDPGRPHERRQRQQRDAEGGEGVADDGQPPVARRSAHGPDTSRKPSATASPAPVTRPTTRAEAPSEPRNGR